mmetsp:Transcript_27553/g.80461  ORF Transcript_27553/g.80461 Transcript_27553/m.80461 type:complete len:290 (+) Transcript_27553:302-1171(+)
MSPRPRPCWTAASPTGTGTRGSPPAARGSSTRYSSPCTRTAQSRPRPSSSTPTTPNSSAFASEPMGTGMMARQRIGPTLETATLDSTSSLPMGTHPQGSPRSTSTAPNQRMSRKSMDPTPLTGSCKDSKGTWGSSSPTSAQASSSTPESGPGGTRPWTCPTPMGASTHTPTMLTPSGRPSWPSASRSTTTPTRPRTIPTHRRASSPSSWWSRGGEGGSLPSCHRRFLSPVTGFGLRAVRAPGPGPAISALCSLPFCPFLPFSHRAIFPPLFPYGHCARLGTGDIVTPGI